jgi:2-succinyl-5-enolpyruvyl-6-hydroxy-3-cyclohexene-1-carboxylate synthase
LERDCELSRLDELVAEAIACAGGVVSLGHAAGVGKTVLVDAGRTAPARVLAVLLIGDIVQAHDIGGLLTNRRLDLALTIALVNKRGGGIFHFLPDAGETDAFEEHVATPHGLDFARATTLCGCALKQPEDLDRLCAAVERSLDADKTAIVEVRNDRGQNVAPHRRVANAVQRRLPEFAQ